MADWSLVGSIAGGGFGLCILDLVILSIVAWIVGLGVRRTVKTTTKHQEEHVKGK